MAALDIHQIPVLNDNCVYLAHEAETGSTAVIDPAVAGPADNRCAFGRLAEARPSGIPAGGLPSFTADEGDGGALVAAGCCAGLHP